ncbi:MAG TPA: NAD(P)-dependent oxidoreductase [Hyphomicrobiaceae bacterium]|jgi:3-hydroxyisobutyrate dehydrogenase-like beta-hydroxyacid dehydrogenase|nr:NAD(P)-dependent oxidoreductase [Hyphomicrobiaceae bacterium]
MAKVAWIGLGVMGYPMAGHIRKKGGHDLVVYNRNGAKAEAWAKEYGGKTAATPADAARDADFVFCCVGNDNDLREVTTGGKGAFNAVKKGAVFIDNTTASANVARELYADAKAKGFDFLDAPVSGGQAGAVNGALTVMIGGDQAPFDKAKPVIDNYARMATLIGPAGAGQLTKMVNQICVAVTVQGVSEGLAFAQRAGLDIAKVMETIGKGAAQSWQMDNRWKTMNDGKFDFGFAVDWMRKDLGIIMEEAKRNGAKVDVATLIDGYYAEVQKMGGGRWDTSSLIARLNKK